MLLFYMVAFLLIRKTWDGCFFGNVGGGIGDFKKWGNPGNGGHSEMEC